jgi:predicted oxidoreductase
MSTSRIKLSNGLEFSRIIHGIMRLVSWNMSSREVLRLTEQVIDFGVTTFDHADIYGNYSCEALFGDALKLKPGIRKEMEIVTKCGINLTSDKFPERKLKYYDYGFGYIVSSVNNALKNLGTDYIDVFLLHRPAPFFDPEEVAKAFSKLKIDGKVLHFGVSNFTPMQFDMLNSYLEEKLVTNQVEISPYCLEHFENGNIDYFLKERIKPMAWSPMAGGKLMNPHEEKGQRIGQALNEVAAELNINQVDKIIYAWLLKHPASIMPVVGSGKLERIQYAVEALNLDMSLEQWYKIYNASTGKELP